MSGRPERLRGREPSAPVVVERAGGGVARFPPDPDARARLRRITREAVRSLGCDRAGVWRMGSSGRGIRVVTRFEAGEERHEDEIRYPEDLGLYAVRVLRRLSVLAMEDAETVPDPPPALLDYLASEGIRALLAVPIRPGGVLEGFLCLEHHARPRRWSSQDRARAVALAQQVERNWSGAASRPPASGTIVPAGPGAESAPEASTEAPAGPSGHEAEQVAGDPGPPQGAGIQRPGFGKELRTKLSRLRPMETAGILATDLAHEVLHLLEVQDGHLALLAGSSSLDEDGGGLLTDAREIGGRARTMFEELLGWARRGGAESTTVLELNSFVGGLAGRLGTVGGERVRLVLAPSCEPIQVRGSARLLGRAIEHLVRNAREASPPGSRVRLAVTRVDATGSKVMASIRVEDQGTGIASGDLPWIFEPFFTTRDRREATGTGLALVQAVAEGHGGWVDVRSTRGEGTVFTVNLPVYEPDVEGAGTTEEKDEAAASDARPLALLIEDDPDLSRLVERALERAGYRVRAVDGLPAARRALDREEQDASLVVVERILPDGTRGAEILRGLRDEAPYLAGMILDRRLRERGPDSEAQIRSADGIPRDVPLIFPPVHPSQVWTLARGLRPSEPAPSDHGPSPGGNGRDEA